MAGEADEGASGPRDARRGQVGGRNLPVAIVVGVVLAGLFLLSLLWHPAAFTGVVALLTVTAYLESHRMLRPMGYPLQVPVLIISTLLMLFGAYQAGHTGQVIGVLVLVVGSMIWQLGDAQRDNVVRMMATTVFFGVWIGFLASFGVLLTQRPEAGAAAVLAAIGAAILTDIGGYAFGVGFGRHKVAPRVSPNKTWEGLLGGLVVATIAGAVVLPLLDPVFTPLTGGVISLACGGASFLGDLTESMIKRNLGVKDLGDVLPGHGGVLDRVDGILIALPVGYVAAEFLL